MTPHERRIVELERIVAVMARMLDPTSPQLSREDRESLVAYARSTRDATGPASTGDG